MSAEGDHLSSGENWRLTARFGVLVGMGFGSSTFRMLCLEWWSCQRGRQLFNPKSSPDDQCGLHQQLDGTGEMAWGAGEDKEDRVLDGPGSLRGSGPVEKELLRSNSLGGKRKTRVVCCPEAGKHLPG